MKKIRQSLSILLVLTLLISAFSLLGISSVSAAGADLTVTAVGGEASTLTIEEGTTVSSKVIATIRNTGDTATSSAISVDFFVDNRFFETVNYADSVAAGGLAVIQTSAQKSFFFGSHSVRAVATYAGDTYAADNKLKNRLVVFDSVYYPPEKYDSVPLDHTATVPAITEIQAETGTTNGGASTAYNHAGFTGTGFVDYVNSAGAGVTIPVTVDTAGTYSLGIRYATASNREHSGPDTNGRLNVVTSAGTNTTATLMMFGKSNPSNIIGPYDSSANNRIGTANGSYWDSWRWTYVDVQLSAGSNTVTLTYDTWGVNIDDITVEKKLTNAEKTITSFWFLKANNPALKGDIQCDVGDGKITATIPANVDVSKLIASFTTANGATVKAKASNGDVQESDVSALNYTNGMELYAGNTKYSVVLTKTTSTNLPYLFIEFTDEVKNSPIEEGDNRLPLPVLLTSRSIADKDKKVVCTVSLDSSNASLPSNLQTDSANTTGKLASFQDVGSSTIKLRGNSTIGDAEKKSYTIKLKKSKAALDMPTHKTWILNGCSDDKTFMRQYIGYQLGTYLNSTKTNANNWSVHMRFTQVWFDGQYLGMYMFGESVKLGETRLNIVDNDDVIENTDPETGEVISTTSKLTAISDATDYDNLSFLVEKDERQGYPEQKDVVDALIFHTEKYGYQKTWAVTSPEDEMTKPGNEALAATYKNCIENCVNRALNTFGNNGNYEPYIDVESFVDFYICYEVMKTMDAGTGYSSVNFFKDVKGGINDGKITAGPVWDFNPGAGNANYDAGNDYNNDSHGYWLRSGRNLYFWEDLFANNHTISAGKYQGKTFAQAVSARYNEIYNAYLKTIDTHIATLETYLANGANDNYTRWDRIHTYAWPQPKIFHSYHDEVNYFKNWMVDRADWLHTQYPGA